MVSPPQDRLLDHSYDGIQEYDNPLPGWWTWTFAGCVFFAGWYLLYFHLGLGPSIYDRYDQAVAEHLQQQLEGVDVANIDDESILALVREGDKAASTAGLFQTHCANCHRDDAGGLVGPDLTDDAWLHATRPLQIFEVIDQGVTSKGMPAWGDRLRPAQLLLLTAYIGTLRGSEPEDPRPPQGQRADLWAEL